MKKLSKKVFSFVAAAVILATTLLSAVVLPASAWAGGVVSIHYGGYYDSMGLWMDLGYHIDEVESFGGDIVVEQEYLYFSGFYESGGGGVMDSASCYLTTSDGVEISYEYERVNDVSKYDSWTEIEYAEATVSVGDSYSFSPDVAYVSSTDSSVVSVSGNTIIAVGEGSCAIQFYDGADSYFEVTVEGSDSGSGGTDPGGSGGTNPGGSGGTVTPEVKRETVYQDAVSGEWYRVPLSSAQYTYMIDHVSTPALLSVSSDGYYWVKCGEVESGKYGLGSVLFTSKDKKTEYLYVFNVAGKIASDKPSVFIERLNVKPGQTYVADLDPSKYIYRHGINEIINDISSKPGNFEVLFTEFDGRNPTYATTAFFPNGFDTVITPIDLSSASWYHSGKPAMSYYSGYPLSYMFDRKSNTRFASSGKVSDVSLSDYWFVIDFGKAQVFDYIVLDDFRKVWKGMLFYTSVDGINWVEVDSGSVAMLYDSLTADHMKVEFLFSKPINTRYLKVEVVHDDAAFSSGNTFSIWEMDFYRIPESSSVFVYEFQMLPSGYIDPSLVDKNSASYLQGQIDGHEAGYKSGKDFGYKQGYEEAKAYYTQGDLFKKAYDEGYAAARRDIVTVSDGNAISGLFQGIWSGLTAFIMPIMNGIGFTSVDGTFISLGSIVMVLLVLSFVGFIVLLFIKR